MKYEKKGDVSYTLGTTLTFELLLRKPEVAKRNYISEKQKRIMLQLLKITKRFSLYRKKKTLL